MHFSLISRLLTLLPLDSASALDEQAEKAKEQKKGEHVRGPTIILIEFSFTDSTRYLK